VDDGQRLLALYQQVLQRAPTRIEDSISRQFLADAQGESNAKLNPWEQLAQLLLLTNEVMYLD
jgi:hypothetical protein